MTRATKYREPGTWIRARTSSPCMAYARCIGDGRIMTGDNVWYSRPPARYLCQACGRRIQAQQRQASREEIASDAYAFNKATEGKE